MLLFGVPKNIFDIGVTIGYCNKLDRQMQMEHRTFTVNSGYF